MMRCLSSPFRLCIPAGQRDSMPPAAGAAPLNTSTSTGIIIQAEVQAEELRLANKVDLHRRERWQ